RPRDHGGRSGGVRIYLASQQATSVECRVRDELVGRRRSYRPEVLPEHTTRRSTMTVSASFCMSLDGFVAHPDDSVGPLFDWYSNGDVEIPMVGYPITFRVSAASA